jgi:hypothetical protein
MAFFCPSSWDLCWNIPILYSRWVILYCQSYNSSWSSK